MTSGQSKTRAVATMMRSAGSRWNGAGQAFASTETSGDKGNHCGPGYVNAPANH